MARNFAEPSRLDLLPALLARHADIALGMGVLSVLVLLIVPVPPFALDLFICVSFSMSFLMLSATTYATRAVELSSFPSLLLLTTLLRIALAIASTKMILLQAHAGQIIQAFGEMVVGGNVAVGVVVFLVLSVIQFIVVAKGADRVAEVAARFTLDGIPGRQMSIDADMRSGVISAVQARQLRNDLERETYFYGSLDGAMKFVKGDTIAGMVVALVNIVGGLAVGIGQRSMSFGDALHTYTILTVGDGLVSQIPSLIVSIAAGLLVTRVSAGGAAATSLGGDIYRQLSLYPKALAMAGIASFALAAIPGFPHLQFIAGGAVSILLAILVARNTQFALRGERPPMPALTRDGGNYVPRLLDDVELGTCATMRLRLGAQALAALDPGALNHQLLGLRRSLMLSMGVPFPGLALLRDDRLEAQRYIVDIDDVPFASGTLVPGGVLVSGSMAAVAVEGMAGYRPGAEKSVWVEAGVAASLDSAEIVRATPEDALCAHLYEVCERAAPDFVGTQEARFLMNQISIEFRDLVGQVDQTVGSERLARVLRELLRQRVAIRNLRGILEAILRLPDGERTIERMVREARIELRRQLIRPYANLETWEIRAHVLAPWWEAELEAQIRTGPDGEPQCVPDVAQTEALRNTFAELGAGVQLVLTSAVLRTHLAQMLQAFGLRVDVIAIEEVPLDVYRVRTVATLEPKR